MNPKRTREALAYWDGWRFGDYPLPDLGALDSILDFARESVGLFEECENLLYHDHDADVHYNQQNGKPCPSCEGRGFTLNRDGIERAAKAMQKRWEDDGEGEPYLWDDLTDKDRDFWLSWAEAAIATFLFGET